jgi:hypothetical protein
VSFSNVVLELIATGAADSTSMLWAAIVPDTAPVTTTVQALGNSELIQTRFERTLAMAVDFNQYSRWVVTTRRTRPGAAFRFWWNSTTAVPAITARVRIVLWCRDRIQ